MLGIDSSAGRLPQKPPAWRLIFTQRIVSDKIRDGNGRTGVLCLFAYLYSAAKRRIDSFRLPVQPGSWAWAAAEHLLPAEPGPRHHLGGSDRHQYQLIRNETYFRFSSECSNK